MTPEERAELEAEGRRRMDEAREAGGNMTCRLIVTEISDTRNVPVAWRSEWVKR